MKYMLTSGNPDDVLVYGEFLQTDCTFIPYKISLFDALSQQLRRQENADFIG